MQLPTIQPQHKAIARIVVMALAFVLVVLLIYRHLKSQAAYARAMNAIAEAAREGENVHIQIAHFQSSDHVDIASDTDK